MYNSLLYTVADKVATITLNRPDVFNAFNDELTYELQDALKKAERDAEVRAVVLTGEGKAFSAGGDLKAMELHDSFGQMTHIRFTNLQRKHEWGSNLYYFLSANYGIHPTYVMELTKDGRYAPAQIVGALEHLNEHGGAQFDRNRLVGITAGHLFQPQQQQGQHQHHHVEAAIQCIRHGPFHIKVRLPRFVHHGGIKRCHRRRRSAANKAFQAINQTHARTR